MTQKEVRLPYLTLVGESMVSITQEGSGSELVIFIILIIGIVNAEKTEMANIVLMNVRVLGLGIGLVIIKFMLRRVLGRGGIMIEGLKIDKFKNLG